VNESVIGTGVVDVSRFSRVPWSRISGLDILPPTLMVAMGHPWLGSATLGVVLGSSALHAWMSHRSEREQDRAFLSFAQDATTLGGDPSPVIAALRGRLADPAERSTATGSEPSRPGPGAAQVPRSPWHLPSDGR